MAVFTDQKAVWTEGGRAVCKRGSGEGERRRPSPKFWACAASISVHLLVLTAFGAVKFSQLGGPTVEGRVPTAKISGSKNYMSAGPRIAKPKVKSASAEAVAARASGLLPARQIFEIPKASSPGPGSWVMGGVSRAALLSAGSGGISKRVEFFGSIAEERKVCYVVDCSGSMKGVFGRVRRRLRESIEKLEADQYFHIVFFGDDRLIEFGDGGLVRATREAKAAACGFVDSVRPVGRTNAAMALERAVQVRDGRGYGPSVIYFLTDGFELSAQDGQRLSRRTANLRRRFAPTTRINTIGFWTQGVDRKALETIATESGGEFSVVTDGGNQKRVSLVPDEVESIEERAADDG